MRREGFDAGAKRSLHEKADLFQTRLADSSRWFKWIFPIHRQKMRNATSIPQVFRLKDVCSLTGYVFYPVSQFHSAKSMKTL